MALSPSIEVARQELRRGGTVLDKIYTAGVRRKRYVELQLLLHRSRHEEVKLTESAKHQTLGMEHET